MTQNYFREVFSQTTLLNGQPTTGHRYWKVKWSQYPWSHGAMPGHVTRGWYDWNLCSGPWSWEAERSSSCRWKVRQVALLVKRRDGSCKFQAWSPNGRGRRLWFNSILLPMQRVLFYLFLKSWEMILMSNLLETDILLASVLSSRELVRLLHVSLILVQGAVKTMCWFILLKFPLTMWLVIWSNCVITYVVQLKWHTQEHSLQGWTQLQVPQSTLWLQVRKLLINLINWHQSASKSPAKNSGLTSSLQIPARWRSSHWWGSADACPHDSVSGWQGVQVCQHAWWLQVALCREWLSPIWVIQVQAWWRCGRGGSGGLPHQ